MTRWSAALLSAAMTLGCALTLSVPQFTVWADDAATTTKDGLELKTKTKSRLVYVRPGATFNQFNKVAILDPYVEFSKVWLRDYNRSVNVSRQIKDSDLEKAKESLSEQFKKALKQELSDGNYQLTDSGGPGVLVLRPALVNIAVSAPDLMTPGRTRVYAQSAGSMTLYLELWDGGSNTILARVVDAQSDPQAYGQLTSTVTNRAAADRIMRMWARELRKKLDLAEGK
jgi:Protein of unknown function (DUF3313)